MNSNHVRTTALYFSYRPHKSIMNCLHYRSSALLRGLLRTTSGFIILLFVTSEPRCKVNLLHCSLMWTNIIDTFLTFSSFPFHGFAPYCCYLRHWF